MSMVVIEVLGLFRDEWHKHIQNICVMLPFTPGVSKLTRGSNSYLRDRWESIGFSYKFFED
jgi:hypothetical protein